MSPKQHNTSNHLLKRLNTANNAGYSQRFHLFESGLVLSVPSRKVYHFEELKESETESCCDSCKNTIQYFTAYDGTKGIMLKPIED